MSDTQSAAPPVLEITAGAIAPAAPEPVAAPAPEPVAAPVANAPAPAPEPGAPEPVAEPPALQTHSEELPSALSTQKPDADAKPADAPKPDAAPAPAPVTEPVVYEFTAPDGITLDQARITPYVDVLKEHGIAPAVGQRLLDMYTAERQQDAVNTLEQQHRAFANVRRGWINEVKADPEMGGAGYQTTLQHAARGRDLLLGNDPKAREEFNQFVDSTGAGDHKVLFRLFLAADRLFQAPVAPVAQPRPTSNGQGTGPRRGMDGLFRNPGRSA